MADSRVWTINSQLLKQRLPMINTRQRQLRWEDCRKRDLRKAEEEEKWREKGDNREQWKQ